MSVQKRVEPTILFDESKRQANLAKHGFDFADLTVEFFGTASVYDGKEGRYLAIGLFRGQAVTVVFRPMGREAISVISMRPASWKERRS